MLSFLLRHIHTNSSHPLCPVLFSFLSFSCSLSLCLSCIFFIAPCFHPHIKAIYHKDQTQCVSQRQADLLVGFLCVCEFYDWGRGPGTQGYISDKICLWLLFFLALFMPSCSAWPLSIAWPHVNATFDLNSWVPEDVTARADQLLQWLRPYLFLCGFAILFCTTIWPEVTWLLVESLTNSLSDWQVLF